MIRLICLASIATAAMAQQFHIDHVTVAGKNLASMQRALRNSGIPSEYGGPHSNRATEMALASFPDGSYLELIAPQPNADAAALAMHEWRKFMEADGGPCAWAIRPTDLAAEVDRLRKSGIAVSDPRKNGRKRPDGVQLNRETAQIGPTNGGFFPFMIHDFTPRDNRAFPGGNAANDNFTGVVKVVIAVSDLNAAIAQYRQAYGLPAPELQGDAAFGAKLAWFPGTPVVLAAPLGAGSWLKDRLQNFDEAPCAFVVGVKNIASDVPPSKWFDARISWANADRLGWRLGFEVR